jgi:hypothetical protein
MTRLAGTSRASALTVDYKDVLEQAVANERWRVLREVIRAVEAVPTSDSHYAYRDIKIDMKRDVLAAIKRLETL